MKKLISFLILVSFLPLQAGAACSMELSFDTEEAPSCHSRQAASDGNGIQFSVDQSSNDDCYICQSGLCDGIQITQEHILLSKIEKKLKKKQIHNHNWTLYRCATPLQERAPPGKEQKKSLLQYFSWQSFYSTFII